MVLLLPLPKNVYHAARWRSKRWQTTVKARKAGDEERATAERAILDENFPHFGYGYIDRVEDLIPNIPMLYFSFRIMVGLAMLFLLVFIYALVALRKDETKLAEQRWFSWVMILSMPLVYICSQCGWIVAEVGRQPWTIQDVLPVNAAVSNLAASSVKVTFFVFIALFTAMLIAELTIMWNAVKKGPKMDEHEVK